MTGKEMITRVLVETSVIPEDYTGQVTLHFGSGSLCFVECLSKQKGTVLDKKVLDIFPKTGRIDPK